MKLSASLNQQSPNEDKNCLNSELWHACAGPLVSLPSIGTHVVYFPQGHSEQVSVSTNKEVDAQIPNYPSLPPQLICQLHNVTMHADIETDEVYAQMTLQPLSPQEQNEVSFHPADLGAASKQPTNYFCKTLTASDTSTHGGFSVPRRSAEKVFPPLDFSQQPPAQELIARDLHNNEWKFRHIFRGQPKRHLLTTGWSVFVSSKRLVAGDSVLFIWNEKNQLLLGIRRANRPQTVMPSSVLSSDSMHLGLLAAAAHAASTSSRFTIFYNPRASPSEFVIPLAKYVKAVYHTRVSVGMRFRMMFETEDSSVRRYMGTITGVSDLDSMRWPNSHWRSVKVGWDESTAGEKQPRVSLWEVEPLTTFPMYPSTFALRLKRPWPPGLPSFTGLKADDLAMNSPFMFFRGNSRELGTQYLNYQGVGPTSPWMQLQPRFDPSTILGMQNNDTTFQETRWADPSKQSQLLFGNRPMGLTTQAQIQQQQQHHPQNLMHNTLFQQQQMLHQSSFDNNDNTQMQNGLHHERASSGGPVFSQAQTSMHISSPLHGPFGPTRQEDGAWPAKRLALDPLPFTDSNSNSSSVQVEQLGLLSASVAHNSVSLPPFPGSNESNDTHNHFLFGLSGLKGVGESETANMGFASSSSVADYSFNPTLNTNNCVEDSGFVPSSDNGELANPTNRAFVKVYKSGSFGRSLDITKFSSYNELRMELARMFGLKAQLEDSLRSGWQLVFVDRENDVLLLGDDPWPEFVNSVYCIKILSPEEVEEMRKQGLELLNNVPLHQNIGCEGYPSRQEPRNMNAGIASVGTLNF